MWIIALIAGVIIGIAILFFIHRPKLQRLEAAEARLKQTRRALEEVEQDNKVTKAALESVQKTEREQIDREIEAVKQQYEAQIQQLKILYQNRIRELEAELKSQSAAIPEEEELPEVTATEATRESEDLNQLLDDYMSIGSEESEFTEELEVLDEDHPVTEPQVIETITASPKLVKKPEIALDLSAKISALGDSGQIANIPQLVSYVHHTDPQIRALVATNLGKIAADAGLKTQLHQVLPILTKLSRDPEVSVRQESVAALAKIKSEKVIPLLQIALRDANPHVIKLASEALNQLKMYQLKPKKKPVPKPSKQLKR